MFYVKNVPNWERFTRLAVSFAIAVLAYLYFGSTLTAWLIIASAVAFSLTGIIGWCPMCALAGRRLDAEKKKRG